MIMLTFVEALLFILQVLSAPAFASSSVADGQIVHNLMRHVKYASAACKFPFLVVSYLIRCIIDVGIVEMKPRLSDSEC